MELKALGKFIHIKKEDMKATKSGIYIPDLGPQRSGQAVVLRRATIISMGEKAKEALPDLKAGDDILYNPNDVDIYYDEATEDVMLDCAGVYAKVC